MNLFLFPSIYREGLPRVILEAGASGLPVVAYDLPGARDAIIDGHTGYLVEKGNIDLMADKICTLLYNPDLYRYIGDNARLYIKENFDINHIQSLYFDIYGKLGLN